MKMLNNQPQPLQSLRDLFTEYARPQTSRLTPLKRFSLVGALPDIYGLPSYEPDSWRFELGMQILSDCGYPIAPDFEVDIINIQPVHGGRDFLAETQPTDVVMLCWVFNPLDGPESGYDYNTPLSGNYMISPDHFSPRSWYEAAKRTEAKIVMIYGEDGGTEVGPGRFMADKPGSIFKSVQHPAARKTELFQPYTLRHHNYV